MNKIKKYLAMTALAFTIFGTAMGGMSAKAASTGTTYIPRSAKASNVKAAKAPIKDTKAPVITLKSSSGSVVAKGGFSRINVTVTVSDANLSIKSVKKNGTSIVWPSNGTFKADGSYIITAKDKSGNTATSSFIIDKTAPVIKVNAADGKAVSNDGISASKASITVTDANLSSKAVTSDDASVSWPSNNTFITDGSYTVTVKDKAGNSTTIAFTIDNELNDTWSGTDMDGLKVYEYGKTLLTTNAEKAVYDQIDKALLNLKSSVSVKVNFDIDNYDEDSSLSIIYSYVISDHPELFYFAGDYDPTPSKVSGSKIIKLKFTYSYSNANIVTMRTTLDTAAKNILAAAAVKTTDLDKETSIHDAVLAGCSYDVDSQYTLDFQRYCDNHPGILTAYGTIIENSAVCEGYAKAMKLLLDSAGIKSLYVTSADHAWNMVQVSGKWYFLDATWDDTYSDTPVYTFFNYSSNSLAALEHDPLTTFDPTSKYLPENYQILPAA